MINTFKQVSLDLLHFLKNPTERPDTNQSGKEQAKKLISILIIDLLVASCLVFIISLLEDLGYISTQDHKLLEMLKEMPIWLFLLQGVIIAPILEELIFRGYLRYKNNYLLRFLIFLVAITGERNRRKTEVFVKKKWNKYYKIVLYFSALLFAYIHISNYENSSEFILFIPLLVTPQFIMGLLLAYLRTRHNVKLGILLHATHNAIFLIVGLLTMNY